MTFQTPTDARERVLAAAAELFEQSGRQAMPTVDAVRRAARVDMNTASMVMKEWRRAQIAKSAPVAVAVPDAVQQIGADAVAKIWQQAQDLAGEALRAAQSGWEAERQQLETVSKEVSDAFEALDAELKAAKADTERMARELATAQEEVKAAMTIAEKAEARSVEIERHVEELRAERDRAREMEIKAREDAAVLLGRLEASRAPPPAVGDPPIGG